MTGDVIHGNEAKTMPQENGVILGISKKLLLKMKKSIILLLTLLILAVLPFWPSDSAGKEVEFLILHTGNVTGHLFPCPT
jgi:hypothetical protein